MRRRRWFVVVWSVLAAAVLAAIFLAYQNPALLVDFSNLLFCG